MIIVNIKIKMVIFKYGVHLLMNSVEIQQIQYTNIIFFYHRKADMDQILLILHFTPQIFFRCTWLIK